MNQKRRTRTAIVAAARAMLDRGERPTIAKVAEEALMSRPTVYRYFPTQESLLLELSVSMSVDSIEQLMAEPADGASPEERVLQIVDGYVAHAAEHEALHRTAIRHYMDAWLAADQAGEGHGTNLREGRRKRWIQTALGPRPAGMTKAERKRLEDALCLVMGSEALVIMHDVCHIDDDAEALGVIRWAAEAILAAGLPAG